MSCHSVTVFLTLVETKQIRISIYKRNNTKNTVETIQNNSKYKYTCYQNTHTYTHPNITKQVKTTTVEVKTNTVQVKTTTVQVKTTTVQFKTTTVQVKTTTVQVKTTTVQVKTNTVQHIPKLNSHNTIKYTQYKVTLMYMALLSQRNSP